jgi:hypothetical protein
MARSYSRERGHARGLGWHRQFLKLLKAQEAGVWEK